jgi:hypothetical protein
MIGEIVRRLESLASRVGRLEAQDHALPSWTAPTLLNSWVNYGPGNTDAGYYRDHSAIVHTRGFVKGGTMDAALFVLDSGYRPTVPLTLPAISWDGANRLTSQVAVDTSGTVTLYGGGTAWFSLDGIAFETF